jgi:hypothetical protein
MFIANLGFCLLEGVAVGATTSLLAKAKTRAGFAQDVGLALTGALLAAWFLSPPSANGGLGNLVGSMLGAVFVAALGRLVSG